MMKKCYDPSLMLLFFLSFFRPHFFTDIRLYFVVEEKEKKCRKFARSHFQMPFLRAISYNSELSQNFLNCCADREKSELCPVISTSFYFWIDFRAAGNCLCNSLLIFFLFFFFSSSSSSSPSSSSSFY